MNCLDIRSLAVFSRLCSSLGVSLDMHCEILSYYLWQPHKIHLRLLDGEENVCCRKYTARCEQRYGLSFYETVLENILEDCGYIETWDFTDTDSPDEMEIIMRDDDSKIYVSYNYLISLLMKNKELTSRDIFGVVIPNPYTFRLVWV